MMNDCVEAFFDEVLGLPFSSVHPDGGVPTAEITTRFETPGKLGDQLRIILDVTKLGRTSMGLRIVADCNGETRFETSSTLVFVNSSGRPREWPGTVREKIQDWLREDGNES